MIVIPPQDPNERRSDPIAEALGSLYGEITQAQDVGNFYDALVKRQELFKAQQQNIEDNFDQYQNMHPRDFYRQFHRQADDDDKAVISEAPYSVRQRLKDSLFDFRQPAFDRASRTYKLLFVNHQLIRLAQDKEFLLNQAADALSDQERDLWLGALAGRLQESGDRGILHKEDAEAEIANLPSEYDTALFTRDAKFDPIQARELLAAGAYPNIAPEKRAALITAADELIDGRRPTEEQGTAQTEALSTPVDLSRRANVNTPNGASAADYNVTLPVWRIPPEGLPDPAGLLQTLPWRMPPEGLGTAGLFKLGNATDSGSSNDDAGAELKRQFATEGEVLRQQKAEGHSVSNDDEEDASNREDSVGPVQVAASGQGRTKAPQKQKGQQPQNAASGSGAKGQPIPGLIGEVRGYSEAGKTNWRAANDQVFAEAAQKYNEKYGLSPKDAGYITPELLKSWAMIESGGEGDRKAFLTDPFQVNDPRNWVPEKAKIAGLKKGEAMTPAKSAAAALEWLRYKSFSYDQRGVPTWLGLDEGLKNYNTKKDLHDNPQRMWQNDYHPGMLHKDWYATAIMLRMFDLLGRKPPSQ